MSTVNDSSIVSMSILCASRTLIRINVTFATTLRIPREIEHYTIEYYIKRDLAEIHELFDKLIRKLHKFLGNYGRSI